MKPMTQKPIMMDARSYIKEHERLVDVLRNGNKEKCEAEAKRQQKHLDMALARAKDNDKMMVSRPSKMKLQAEGSPLMHMEY
jgi:hypothetical protein